MATEESRTSKIIFFKVKNWNLLINNPELQLKGWPYDFMQYPLVLFLMHISGKIFGLNEFSVRLIPALLGSLSIILMYLLGTYLYNERVGLLSAFFLMISPDHLYMSRLVKLSVPMLFFMIFSIYFYFRGKKEEKTIFYILSGISLGLGVLSKYVAILLLLIIILYELLEHKNIEWMGKNFFCFVFSFLLVFLPWNVYWLFRDPQIFLKVIQTYLYQYGSVEKDVGVLSFSLFKKFFYLKLAKGVIRILTPLPLILTIFLLPYIIQQKEYLLVSWIVVVGLFFILYHQWHYYVFPMAPALVLVVSKGLDHIKRRTVFAFLLILLIYSSVCYTLNFSYEKKLFDDATYREAGEYLNTITNKSAKIASSNEAVGFYAKRKTTFLGYINISQLDEYDYIIIENNPAYISNRRLLIGTNSTFSITANNYLRNLIHSINNYEFIKTIYYHDKPHLFIFKSEPTRDYSINKMVFKYFEQIISYDRGVKYRTVKEIKSSLIPYFLLN